MRGDGRDRRVGVAVGEGMVDADVVRGELVVGGITIMEEVVVLDEGEDEGEEQDQTAKQIAEAEIIAGISSTI